MVNRSREVGAGSECNQPGSQAFPTDRVRSKAYHRRMSTIAPFGSWESPIGAADTVAGIVRFSDIQYDDGTLYWLESRPSEQGRTVLLRRSSDGTEKELLSDTANVRTMVHEYGGAAYLAHGGEITYSEFTDQRLYRMSDDGATPLTPEPPRPMSVRFGDAVCGNDGSIICVRESHPSQGEATNELVCIDAHAWKTLQDQIAAACRKSNAQRHHDKEQIGDEHGDNRVCQIQLTDDWQTERSENILGRDLHMGHNRRIGSCGKDVPGDDQ